jgi:hypothetical protein
MIYKDGIVVPDVGGRMPGETTLEQERAAFYAMQVVREATRQALFSAQADNLTIQGSDRSHGKYFLVAQRHVQVLPLPEVGSDVVQ